MSEDIQKIYSDSLEDWPMAPDEVRDAYSQIHDELEKYVAAIQAQAFSYGYEQGIKAAESRKKTA